MALSDCVKCWETPCVCGHNYKDRSLEYRINLAAVILGIDSQKLYENVKSILPNTHSKK